MPSVIQLLMADHRKLKTMLKKVYNSSEKDTQLRKETFAIIKFEATLHEKAEEKFLYPFLKEYKKSRPNAFEHHEEVAVMNYLVSKLTKGPCNSEVWTAQFTVLKELTEHHIEEEEDEFFPQAAKLLSRAELNEIGDKVAKFKKSQR